MHMLQRCTYACLELPKLRNTNDGFDGNGATWCMQELFKEKHYADLDGGILEGFGRLLKYDLKLYVYPTLDEKTGKLITAETLQVILNNLHI